jgi:ectoine hydroxylase-related dioxygenase (phytanoyl-CoA dioxygenase family)
MKKDLKDFENKLFESKGWIGSYPLLKTTEANDLSSLYDSYRDKFVTGKEISSFSTNEKFINKPWFKSLHAVIPSFYNLATHPKIVSKVCSILGENVILWGTSVTVREPGQTHRWHIDVEHKRWKGLSVFIGLSGSSSLSTLKVVSGSHKIECDSNFFSNTPDDVEVLNYSLKYNKSSKIETIDINEGDFFLFDGLLWHGSENKSNLKRYAVIAQYSTPDSKIEVPLNWNEPIRWANCNPPCVLVSGTDKNKFNNLIQL